MKKICLAVIIFFAISGCATFRTIETKSDGNKIDKSMIDNIKPGVTTKKAVIEVFGQPSKTIKKDDGSEELIYSYTEKKTPSYFSGFIVKERNAVVTTTILEIIIKGDIVLGYKFAKTEE